MATRSSSSAISAMTSATFIGGGSTSTVSNENDSDMSANDVRVTTRSLDIDGDDIQTYLSVMWGGGKLGLAFYDTESCQVQLMMDVVETEDFQILKRVKQQILPTCVITSSKQDDRLIKALTCKVNDLGELIEDENTAIDVQILPSLDFSLEVSKRRILNVSLPCIPEDYTESERTIYLTSLVPFEHVNMVRATGGLLKYLDKRRIGVELEESDIRVPILGLKTFSLHNMVLVDDNTYSALQIFHKEHHPSIYKFGGSGSKEGLSLFGELWFLRPLQDVQILKERQDAVAFFLSPRNIEVVTSLQDCLRHIKHVSRILTRMRMAQASIGDWQALYKIANSFSEDLHRIANLISKIVDFDESAVLNRFVVKPNVDQDLDEKKRTYNGLPDFMTKVAKEELKKLSSDIKECNVIYLPQLGYLLAIPRTPDMKEEQHFHIDGLEFMVRISSVGMMSKLLMYDHETSIMHRLQDTVLEHSQVLFAVMEHAAELDCFVPAESASIGIIDRIFTRIHTRESVSVGLSTFMIDLNQVSVALRCATERSLVIIDEFGKGTDIVDGIALLCASLQHWLQMNTQCPHVFVSSHFHTIIQQRLLPNSSQLSFQTLEALQDGNDLVFLYQLIDGHATCSYAHHIAAVAGLPDKLIHRAKHVETLLKENRPVRRADSSGLDAQYKCCETIVNRFLSMELKEEDLNKFLKDFVIPASKDLKHKEY
uniref:MutS protein homolog 5-like n=1 Tax=Saccoglossus kowalevskii TaxID=10224 RepID=A0ABM0LU89_SACKO|nr:PREDICTED: mutS protein homolog 5-like [Saccoglossus kowalevskii]